MLRTREYARLVRSYDVTEGLSVVLSVGHSAAAWSGLALAMTYVAN
jgi:hypothetical protein